MGSTALSATVSQAQLSKSDPVYGISDAGSNGPGFCHLFRPLTMTAGQTHPTGREGRVLIRFSLFSALLSK